VLAPLPPFVLYGSGDFHHLAGWLLRRVAEPVTVVSFDNHPDWDVRPPRWACGGWVNRALELATVQRVAVWGCGNFELAWPSRMFANRRALREERLEVHGWAERFGMGVRKRFDLMERENWRERFERFAEQLAGSPVYMTVDLDCLRSEEAMTNWENGLFTAADVAWAVERLRATCRMIGGDLCGAYSPPRLERWTQRLASAWDHPKIEPIAIEEVRQRNHSALETIWPAVIGSTHQPSS
jgi:arginase family enzyme